MPTQDTCRLYLIRHGQTIWNVENRISGQSDSPLTDKGIKNSQKLARRLKSINFDAIYSSDLGRAKATAKLFSTEREISLQTSSQARERNYGIYEGKKADEFLTHESNRLKHWKSLPIKHKWPFRINPSMETDEEVAIRFTSFLKKIAKENQGKTLLVVTHSGPLRLFLMFNGFVKYGKLPSGAIKNSGYVDLEYNGKEFTLLTIKGLRRKNYHNVE